MTVDSAKTLFAYNRWANDRTLQSVAGLSSEELTRHFSVSFRSLQATLAHIIGVEWLYLMRWAGESPTAIPGMDRLSVDALREFWQTVLEKQDSFLRNLTEAKLHERITYINLSGRLNTYPLADMVQHLVNHSTYHRGQVVFLLRMLGKVPASTDYLLYFDQLGQ